MIILFQNVLLLKEFAGSNFRFVLFTKSKKGSATSFWCIFSAWSFHKNVSYLLYQLTKFNLTLFFLLKVSMYYILIWTIDDFINFNIYISSPSKAIAVKEKKEGKIEIQKFKYLENEKSFIDEIKSIFHNFSMAII